jgi:hypothetical protein
MCVHASWGRQGGAVRIENEALIVACRADGGQFTIVSKSPGRAFVIRGSFPDRGGPPRRRTVSSRIWGAGETIEVESISGHVDSLTLFPGLPFVTVQHTFANDTQAATTIDRYRPVRVMLDTIKPAGEFRALGTAGLTGVEATSNPGSYSFLAIADPGSRAGVVTGWLTHERGSGVLFSDVRDGRVVVEARLDYGRLLIEPGEEVESETLLVGYFDDARLGLEAYADAVAQHHRIQLPPQPTVYCTWYHAGASNERDILTSAGFAKEHLAPYGFSVIQIDDKWQAGEKLEGPRKDFNRHRADGPYPSGMKQTAEKLKRVGMTPGIWFMPFAGTWNDPFFADKQHLFAKKDGEPFVVKWGGTCFDMTNPQTRAYVRAVARRIGRDWGYEYFKLDGLWTGMAARICYINTGYQEDHLGESVLHDPHKTHVEAYRDGLKLVRETAGDGVFFLGCNVAQNMRTLGASFGLLDAMRIGPDNGRNWKSMCRGPFSGSNLYFLHRRVWYNDPDPIYVRDSVPLEHARALTSWVALTGQLNASSTDYTMLSSERLRLLQRSMPAHDLRPRPVDLFEQRIPRIWLLTDDRRRPRRDVIGLFNWQEKDEGRIACPLMRLGLSDSTEYVGFDYWADSFVAPFQGTLTRSFPPASCQILAVRPVAAQPQLISTSRHITQGIIDVLEERWDEREWSLHGVSSVVGRDPYELRIAAMGPTGPWRARTPGVSKEDAEAGVTIRLQKQQGWRVRVQIDSPVNRQVRWSIGFAPAEAG